MAFLICNNTKLSLLSCQGMPIHNTHIFLSFFHSKTWSFLFHAALKNFAFIQNEKDMSSRDVIVVCGKTWAGVKIATNTHAYFKIAFPGIFKHIVPLLLLWILNWEKEREKVNKTFFV